MLRLGEERWELHRQGDCGNCGSASRFHDRDAALHWLRQFKGNVVAIDGLRYMLSQESGSAYQLDRATDDDIIEQAARLLGFGVWHVHEPVERPQFKQTQGLSAESGTAKGGGDSKSSDDARDSSTPAAASQPSLARMPRESRSSPPGPAAPPAAKQLTWIEIRLLDSEGNPVPGMKYEVTLPDGAVRSGSLDSKGTARYDQIVPGQCAVKFPDLDAKEWRPA